MESYQTTIAQRSKEKLCFDHKSMDYYFSWIVDRQNYDGSDACECIDVATRIVNGDPHSWQHEWSALAERVEDQAQTIFRQGYVAEARAAYLRACTYYRAPLFIMQPHDAAFHRYCQKMRACFQNAAALFDPPIEHIQLSFQGKLLPGYFWQVDTSGQKRPTIIVIGGIETFAEDCYFMIGSTGREQGYHILIADLPGQGLNPDNGLFFEARMEQAVQATVDYAAHRPDVDADRLALFGFSWGGHFVCKGGQHDRRIKAVIASPPMPNVFRAILAQHQSFERSDPITRLVLAQIAWRLGLKISLNPRDIVRCMTTAYDYLVYGKANPRKILCPMLCLADEDEAPLTLQIACECCEQLPHPLKQLVIFTKESGEAHDQAHSLAPPYRMMFDWLDGALL